jgi:hypothetical protein
MNFHVHGADFASANEYAVFGKSSLGQIAIYVTPQGRGGTIDLTTNSYTMFPLGGTKGLLTQRPEDTPEAANCSNENSEGDAHGYCEDDCGDDIVDVLVLVTPGANAWLDVSFGWLGQLYLFIETHNINGAFINSIVPNKRVRVQFVNFTPNFGLTTDIGNDLNLLSANSAAQSLLYSRGADIGLLLTNQGYVDGPFNIFGIANSLDPLSTNKFCIAEVAFIGPIRYTFAHEIAHQFGCLHSNPFTEGCPHGRNMPNGRNTIMANGAANNTRIQNFSNPGVLFGGVATGVAATRDNAAQIRGAFCDVANNNAPVWFAASIAYDRNVCIESPFTASVSAGGSIETWLGLQYCFGPYTYEWSWSPEPTFSSSYVISTSSSLNLAAPPNCPSFYLRVKVTSPYGCETTSTEYIQCQAPPCPRSYGKIENKAAITGNYIIPNPASYQARIRLEDNYEVRNIIASNTSGSQRHNLKFSRIESGELLCDVSELIPGFWLLSMEGGPNKTVLKLTVIR